MKLDEILHGTWKDGFEKAGHLNFDGTELSTSAAKEHIHQLVNEAVGQNSMHATTHSSEYPLSKGYGEACTCDLSSDNKLRSEIRERLRKVGLL